MRNMSRIIPTNIRSNLTLQDRLDASKAQEVKAAEEHRRELRKSLEEAEARLATAESARRTLQADLHRQKAITSDKSAEIQV